VFYCGIDLSATSSHLCVLDESLSIHIQQKAANELPRIVDLLLPFKPDLQIVVESTFNWYWLVDGLQKRGFDVSLAHTLGLALITQAKVKTDRRDAFTLVKLLKAGLIPTVGWGAISRE
jgi:transposase